MSNIQIKKVVSGVATDFDPVTNDDNVELTSSNTSLPNNASSVKDVIDGLTSLAFTSDTMVRYTVSENAQTPGISSETEIDDDNIDEATTWSSDKLSETFENLATALGLDYDAENNTFTQSS